MSEAKYQKLDEEFSRLFRESRKCFLCGGDCVVCHIEGRRNLTVRWTLINVLPMCHEHHMYSHEKPLSFYEMLDSRFPGRRESIWAIIQKNQKVNLKEVENNLKEGKDQLGEKI